MAGGITIALDAMGGDLGPEAVVGGASLARIRHPNVHYEFHGDEKLLAPLLETDAELKAVSSIHHTDVAVSMSDKPSQALRAGRRVSSMWLAIDAVKQGRAQAALSCGNTGALTVMSRMILKTMPGIDRPALAAIWPTMRGESIVLDVGANVVAEEKNLVNFAIMGEAMARTALGQPKPTVGLLNIGAEEMKGNENVKGAAQVLRNTDLEFEFYGFVEGDDISKGTVDVVVTDGFTGNIALKTAEGTARLIGDYLSNAMRRSLASRIGYLLARGAFNVLRKRMDPSSVNGGVFLGLNGVVVKSHGSATAAGIASALDLAIDMARHDIIKKISADLETVHTDEASAGEATAEPEPVAS
ncbi:phosphate acyltransferase PlsX [Pyruvatibacter sp.]|uniref:phosphate acyltransferase PlsX n=1 Tax=Pyruvatibacter sp. TaxID=1981328 RepID=UPI0032EE9583